MLIPVLVGAAVGALSGAGIAWWLSARRQTSRLPAPSPAPPSAGAAGAPEHPVALEDPRFGRLLPDALEDLMREHGATGAACWRVLGERLETEREVGLGAGPLAADRAGQAMLRWVISEGMPTLGPDGDAPTAVAAPLAAPGEAPAGALALTFAAPFTGDRAALKRAVARQALRLRLLSELLTARDELALTNRRIRRILREVAQWDAAAGEESLGAQYCALASALVGADGAAVVRWDETAQRGHVTAATGTALQVLDVDLDPDSLVADACRNDVPGLWHDVGEGRTALLVCTRDAAPLRRCVLVQPLRRGTEVIGALIAVHDTPGALRPADLRTLTLLDLAATSRLVASWRLAEARERATIDGLTGLTNRLGFEAAMLRSREEAVRFGWETTLLLLDLDHFKAINDGYGHEAGDTVLRAVAATLADRVRAVDCCARLGGEEFAVLLKGTGRAGGAELAERLRRAVESLRMQAAGQQVAVTVSIGGAVHPGEVADWAALYRSADAALYAAKHAGRNRVRFAGDGPTPLPPEPLSGIVQG